MKTRVFAAGLFALSAALTACGGGGGSAPGPVPTPPPTATPSPSPAPTLNPNGCVGSSQSAARRILSASPRPLASGDSFTYSGTYSETIVRSEPCPEPTATSNATLATTVTDTNGSGGTVDSKAIETASFPTNQVVTTTDSTLKENATQELLSAVSSTDSNGNSVSTTYTSPQVIDEFPETAGAQWGPNNPASQVTETFADGTGSSRTVNSNGTYTETDTGAGGASAQIQTNADGSGTYNVYGVSLAYAAPANNQIVETIGSGSSQKQRTIPLWYALPLTLTSDTFVDNGQQTIPAVCPVPASVTTQTTGEQIVETLSVTDPVLGYIETRTTTSYDVAGPGQVCITIADSLKQYYDYFADTLRIDYQTTDGNPLQTDTISEAIYQSAAPTVLARRRLNAQAGIPATLVAGRIAAIDHVRALQRHAMLRALAQLLKTSIQKGAVR